MTVQTFGPPRIPMATPVISEDEIDAVVRVLRSGQLAQGEIVGEFEMAFANFVGSDYAVATSSGTTALHLALLAHGIGPGDEVITTPFTFIATANAIRYAGATPVFADVDPETLNLSPNAVRAAITQRTRAVLPVHLYGNPCDIEAMEEIARAHGLVLIEDACQAHGATFADKHVGTSGTGCFSFYATKNITCGEGGMITTSDPLVAERARLMRGHGMRQAYVHEELGYNFRMTDIHAAIGLAQLPRLSALNALRAEHARTYDLALGRTGVRRPLVHPRAKPAWHQYTLQLESSLRDVIAERLRERGISVGIYYPIPLHRQPVYAHQNDKTSCPVAETAAQSVLSIPVHPSLDEEQVAHIARNVKDALFQV